MAVAHYRAGNTITTVDTGLNTGGSITLTGAAPGICQRIYDVSFHAAGTITAYTLKITKNDGTTVLTQVGGQVGGAATGPLGPQPYTWSRPINCVANDNATITLTVTGATGGTVAIACNYELCQL